MQELLGLGRRGIAELTHAKYYKTIKILNQHFKAGEWGKKRCGSVVTTMLNNMSRYCILQRFVEVQQKAFAIVTWLTVPTYPYAPNPLVVKVRVPTRASSQPSCILAVEDIIPTHVSVFPADDGVNFYVMRGKGTDRTVFTRTHYE